jgi:hypothetical protein
MDPFFRALTRPSNVLLAAGLILTLSSHAAPGAESCDQLVALSNQYTGVELTGTQKQYKRKMVAWYVTNCVRKGHR